MGRTSTIKLGGSINLGRKTVSSLMEQRPQWNGVWMSCTTAYTHWLPLPILHASDTKEAPIKKSSSVRVERLEALQQMFEKTALHLIQSQETCYQYAARQIAELIAEYK